MRARLLGAVVALAVVAIVVIWWRGGRSSSSSAPTDAPSAAAPHAGATPRPGRPPVGKVEVPAGQPAPGEAGAGAAGATADDRGMRTYVMDNGAVVQDHRGGPDVPPIDPPPMPPSKRTMDPSVTAKVYLQLKPMVAGCAGKFDPADLGGDPFVYVTMTVAVTKGTLAPTDVYPTLHDLKGPSAQRFTDCLRARAMTMQLPDSGEPDRSDYIVQYPIRLK